MCKRIILLLIASLILSCAGQSYDDDGKYFLAPDQLEKNKYYLNFKTQATNSKYSNSQLFLVRAEKQCLPGKVYVIFEYQGTGDEQYTITDGSLFLPLSRKVTRYSGSFYCDANDSQLRRLAVIEERKAKQSQLFKPRCDETIIDFLEPQLETYVDECVPYLEGL